MIVLVSTIPTAWFNLICCVSILCGKVIGAYVVLQSVVTWVICVWPVFILACLVSLIYILSWAFSSITSKLKLPGMTRTILLFPGHKISTPSEMVEGQEIWAEHSWSSLHAWSLVHAGQGWLNTSARICPLWPWFVCSVLALCVFISNIDCCVFKDTVDALTLHHL